MLLFITCGLWLISMVVAQRVVRSLVNPMTAFTSTWLLAVALYQSGIVQLYPLLLREELLLGLGMASFLAGAWIISCAQRISFGGVKRFAYPTRTLLGVVVVALGGFAYLVYSFSKKASILVYFIAPEEVERLGFQLPVVGYLSLLNIILPGLLVVQGRRVQSNKWAWYTLACVSLVTTPVAGIKSYFMQGLLAMVMAILYDSGRLVNKLVFRSLAITLVLAAGFFVAYDVYFKDETRDYVTAGMVDLPEELSLLARPIVYTAVPISTFGPFSRFQSQEYFGKATLRGVAKTLSKFEPTAIPPHNALFYSVPMDCNTYSFFREPYEDGREVGMMIVPFCYGLFVQWLFFRMKAAPTVPLVGLTAFVSASMILSPFAGFLVSPKAAYFLVVLMGLHFRAVRVWAGARCAGTHFSLFRG